MRINDDDTPFCPLLIEGETSSSSPSPLQGEGRGEVKEGVVFNSPHTFSVINGINGCQRRNRVCKIYNNISFFPCSIFTISTYQSANLSQVNSRNFSPAGEKSKLSMCLVTSWIKISNSAKIHSSLNVCAFGFFSINCGVSTVVRINREIFQNLLIKFLNPSIFSSYIFMSLPGVEPIIKDNRNASVPYV